MTVLISLIALCLTLTCARRLHATGAASLRVTYPAGPIDSLRPWIAFIGPPHQAWQAQIFPAASKDTTNPVWDSGTIQSPEFRTRSEILAGNSSFLVHVRVQTDGVWSPWSEYSAFQTPSSPAVRILEPLDAGRAIGPGVRLTWEVEAGPGDFLTSLEVTVDGEAVAGDIRPGQQEATLLLDQGLHSVRVIARTSAGESEASSRFYVWCSPQTHGRIVVLDLSEVGAWDVAADPEAALRMYELLHAAACLQGIVNRHGPHLMLRLFPEDDSWLAYLRKSGAWLEKAAVTTIKCENQPERALLQALGEYPDQIKGLVVWDAGVPATSNVATTASGVQDLLPVQRTDGPLGSALIDFGLPVALDLRGRFTGAGTVPETNRPSTGSAKCDAYLWAKERYLDTGRCNARRLGYWLDAFWLTNPGRLPWWECCLSNHDWITKHRGFVFDLSNWDDEAPQDDPAQTPGTDLMVFKEIMQSAYQRAGGQMIHVSGFTPWAHKYTEISEPPGKRHAVHTEWEVVRILSAYNAYLDADAIGISALANASLWSWMPLAGRYLQNPAPSPTDLAKLGYMDAQGKLASLGFTLFYVGDFDSAAWLYRREQELWAQGSRGDVPMGWAFNPNLSERFAPGLHFAFENKTPQDFFTSGDSGAGYVNPTMMQAPRPISGLPGAEDIWVDHCREFYRQFDYSITGFLINGHAGRLTEASEEMTARFSPDGAATQPHWNRGANHLTGGMPVALIYGDLEPGVDSSAGTMAQARKDGPEFLAFRIILLGPDYVRDVSARAQSLRPDAPFAMLDPYSFYYLLRHSLGGHNTCRAAWSFDTLGQEVAPGQHVRFSIGVRNNGWDVWDDQCVLRWGIAAKETWDKALAVRLPGPVNPGQGVVVTVEGALPSEAGEYLLFADLERPGKAFREAGNLAWVRALHVR